MLFSRANEAEIPTDLYPKSFLFPCLSCNFSCWIKEVTCVFLIHICPGQDSQIDWVASISERDKINTLIKTIFPLFFFSF